jgi:hypothetical protein
MSPRLFFLLLIGFGAFASTPQLPEVRIARVPNGGIQPQVVVEPNGTLDILYFSGDPKGGNLFFVRSKDQGQTFSSPLQVNSQPGSAIALGTIRGGQMALGAGGRVHVAWNGVRGSTSSGAYESGIREGGKPHALHAAQRQRHRLRTTT